MTVILVTKYTIQCVVTNMLIVIHTPTHTHAHTRTNTHMDTHVHTHTHTHTHTYAHAHAHTQIESHSQTENGLTDRKTDKDRYWTVNCLYTFFRMFILKLSEL